MSYNWSLKGLYESFESEAFQNDLKKIDEVIETFKGWVNEVTKDTDDVQNKLESYILRRQELNDLILTAFSYASLTLSAESTNEQAAKYKSTILQKKSQTEGFIAKMNLWIGKIEGIQEVIEGSASLKEHAFFIEEILNGQKYMVTDREEAVIAQMKNNGSIAWETYKNKVISTHQVAIEIEGEEKLLPLTAVLNMAYESDKAVREKAYHAEIASYKAIEEGVAAALNAIKGEVLTICDIRGYESPIQMTLETARMDKETLDAMLTAMKETMPLFRKYLRRKAELLGYKNGLPWYELYASVVQKEMPYPYEKGKELILKNFASFSENLANLAKDAIEKEWIDVYPKAGKVGGAFCSGVKRLGECRILLNYGDTLGDAVTMAHELGHGFHNRCLNGETNLNSTYPMPLAETASNFCEAIVKKAAMNEVEGEEKLMILETELSDCTQTIVDIYSRYLFESAFFEKRKKGYVSVSEIKELMIEAQKEAYGDGLDENFLHPYMWTWKSHYYYAERNFYNFPYAFGLLFARGLYAQYEQDKVGFPAKYEALLAVTGKMNIVDVVKTAGLDVHDINFWRQSLKTVEEDIHAFLALTE